MVGFESEHHLMGSPRAGMWMRRWVEDLYGWEGGCDDDQVEGSIEVWGDFCSHVRYGEDRFVMASGFPTAHAWEEPDWENWDEDDWEEWEENETGFDDRSWWPSGT